MMDRWEKLGLVCWLLLSLVVLVLLVDVLRAETVTYASVPPTTGSPCVSWRWEAFDVSGFRFLDVLTDQPQVTVSQGEWASRVRCRCRDEQGRWSPLSQVSEVYRPAGLVAHWFAAGAAVRMAGLTMVVAFAQTEAWPDSLR